MRNGTLVRVTARRMVDMVQPKPNMMMGYCEAAYRFFSRGGDGGHTEMTQTSVLVKDEWVSSENIYDIWHIPRCSSRRPAEGWMGGRIKHSRYIALRFTGCVTLKQQSLLGIHVSITAYVHVCD